MPVSTSRVKTSVLVALGAMGLVMTSGVAAHAQTSSDTASVTASDTVLSAQSADDSVRGYAPPPGLTDTSAAAGTTSLAPGGVPHRDLLLERVCAGLAAGSPAPGLLAVVFRPGTAEEDRQRAARAVGGTLKGPTESGEEYVRLPDGAALNVSADSLIRLGPVTRVSPATCLPPIRAVPAPAGPAPDAAADTTRRTATDSTTTKSTPSP